MPIKKEDLEKLKLTPEQVEQVLGLSKADELELKQAKDAVAERDSQIGKLKGLEGDATKFKEQVELLQRANKEAAEKHKAELTTERKRFAVKQHLLAGKRKPHDVDLTLSQFDLEQISLADNGHVLGVKEQADKLTADKPFLFADEQQGQTVVGMRVHPKSAEGADKGQPNNPQGGSFGASIAAKALALSGHSPK
jgi:small-conductance mechanosensitive channel